MLFLLTLFFQSLLIVLSVKVLECIDREVEHKLLMNFIALKGGVFIADILDEITYMSVEWGRSYEILAKSLEHS